MQYIIIHALLDITCKAVFQVVMLQFRLTIEDHDFDELQEEKTRVMGSKELVELAKDTNTKAYLGRTVLPWADDASVGSSQLMSRARRQRMLYEHERGITSSDPAAQKLRELVRFLRARGQERVVGVSGQLGCVMHAPPRSRCTGCNPAADSERGGPPVAPRGARDLRQVHRRATRAIAQRFSRQRPRRTAGLHGCERRIAGSCPTVDARCTRTPGH